MKEFLLKKVSFLSGMGIGIAIMAINYLGCAALTASLIVAALLVYVIGLSKGDCTPKLRKIAIVLAVVLVIRRNLP